MRTEDVLGIVFGFFMLLIAVSAVRNSRYTREELRSRMRSGSLLVVCAVFLGAFSGFMVGGKIGLIGNSTGAFLWSAWGVTVWAAQKSKKHEGLK